MRVSKGITRIFSIRCRGYKRLLFTSLYPWQNLVAETWWYFSGSSVFLGLSNFLNPAPFPHKKVWKLLVPLKVQGILWKVAWSLGGEFLRLIGYRSFILIMHCPLTVALCVTMDIIKWLLLPSLPFISILEETIGDSRSQLVSPQNILQIIC